MDTPKAPFVSRSCPDDTQMKAPAGKPEKKTATKRRAFATPSNRNGAAKPGAKPENPFDKFANARKKHEVLNRRVKGEDRNMGRAREKAIDERKTKLLKDYQSVKKSNVVLDKRFGESDPTLSLEERMFMRFQKEKVKHVRNSSAFNLESGDTEVLTHRGQVLGNSNLEDNDWVSSDEEEGGGRLNKQVVNDLHFGGGFQEKRPTEELPGKGRLDALQEIVMKSKLHKMQKKEAKEEQEEERTKLDKAYQELFSSSMLDFNPTGSDKKYGRSAGSNTADALDDYDIALKEMAYEAKLPASERTKTVEEIALEEQKRIEELEEARLKRMKAPKHNPADAENDDEADGKNAKRKRRTDDQIEDDGYKVVGKNRTNPRDARKEKASDDALSGEAYKEYIMQDEEYSDSDEEEEDGDGDEEDEGDEDEEGSDDEEDGLDYESEPEAEEGEEGSDAEEDGDEDDEEDEEEEVVAPVSKGKKAPAEATSKAPVAISSKAASKQSKAVAEEVCDGVNIEMPHKIDCPPDLEAFDELVEQYVLNGNTDMQALIDRILAWNNVHLPGAEGKENRNLMHNFLDILLKHLIRVGDSLPSNDTEQLKQSMDMLDYLSRIVFRVSTDVGEQTCAALWGRTIKILHAQLQKRLRDYAQGERAQSCWPSLGRLLLLQLLGRVFSVTDLRNDVVGPASLLLCQCLSQCPVSSTADVSSGLLAATVLSSYHAEARRYVPEVVAFVHTVLSLFLPDAANSASRPTENFQGTFSITHLSSLREQISKTTCSAAEAKVQWFMFSSKAEASAGQEGVIAAGVLNTAYSLLSDVVTIFQSSSALPEIVAPVVQTLRSVRPQSKPAAFPVWAQERHLSVLERVMGLSEKIRSTRQFLQWRKAATTSIEMKTPRFQLDYTFKKDIDPDQDRAKVKQLTRQLKREKKAAMRELRRDSDFIDQERYKEQQEAKEFRRAERVKNFAFMEEQQATINLQVRKGNGLMTGGGSGVAKKARVKRM